MTPWPARAGPLRSRRGAGPTRCSTRCRRSAPRNGRRDPWADRARPEGLNGANGTGTDLPPRNGTPRSARTTGPQRRPDRPAGPAAWPERPGPSAVRGPAGPRARRPAGSARPQRRRPAGPAGPSGPRISPAPAAPAYRAGARPTLATAAGERPVPPGPAELAGSQRPLDLPGYPAGRPARPGPDRPAAARRRPVPGTRRYRPPATRRRPAIARATSGRGPADGPGRTHDPASAARRIFGPAVPADPAATGRDRRDRNRPGRGPPRRAARPTCPGRDGPGTSRAQRPAARGCPPPGARPAPGPPRRVTRRGRTRGAERRPDLSSTTWPGSPGPVRVLRAPGRSAGATRRPRSRGLPGRRAPRASATAARCPRRARPCRAPSTARGTSPYRTPPPTGDLPRLHAGPRRAGRPEPVPAGHLGPPGARTRSGPTARSRARTRTAAASPGRDSLGGSELFTAAQRPGARCAATPGRRGRRSLAGPPAARSRARGGDGAEGTLPPAPAGAAEDVRLSIFEDLQSEWFVQRESGAKAESWQMAADDGWAARPGWPSRPPPARRPPACPAAARRRWWCPARSAARPRRAARCPRRRARAPLAPGGPRPAVQLPGRRPPRPARRSARPRRSS